MGAWQCLALGRGATARSTGAGGRKDQAHCRSFSQLFIHWRKHFTFHYESLSSFPGLLGDSATTKAPHQPHLFSESRRASPEPPPTERPSLLAPTRAPAAPTVPAAQDTQPEPALQCLFPPSRAFTVLHRIMSHTSRPKLPALGPQGLSPSTPRIPDHIFRALREPEAGSSLGGTAMV